jgi:hypothetical protein
MMLTLGLIIITASLVSGCATQGSPPGGEGGPPPELLRGFEDIPVPVNVDLSHDESFIYESQVFRAGVLVYYGYVKIDSLVSYFKNAMPQQGWRLVNSFFYKGATLNFDKGNRSAVITINRGRFRSRVEIRVGPTGAPARRQMK